MVLTREREAELAALIRQGSIEARDTLIMGSQSLVRRLATRYGRKGIPRADVVQEGNLGLLRAVADFDPTEGVRFSTYAAWWVRSAMLALILGDGNVIRTPPHHWRIRHASVAVSDVQAQRLEASDMASTVYPIQEDQPESRDASPEELVGRCEDISLVRAAIDRLNPVEAFILRARFGLDGEPLTREIVAERTGLTVAWVVNIQKLAMGKIRDMIDQATDEVKINHVVMRRWTASIPDGTTMECEARDEGIARATFKAMLGGTRKMRLPRGTVVKEIA